MTNPSAPDRYCKLHSFIGSEHQASQCSDCQELRKGELRKISHEIESLLDETSKDSFGFPPTQGEWDHYEDNKERLLELAPELISYLRTLEQETERWRNAVEDARNTAADIWEDKMLPNHDSYKDVAADYKARCVKLQDRMNEVLSSIPLRP